MRSIVMVQPREGSYNKVMKPWVPLSLLAATARLDQEGYPITVIDQRVEGNWKQLLTRALASRPICVGVTSMTGSQILGAIETSRLTRSVDPRIPIVWGGVHSTLFPDQTLANDFIDIIVKNEGEDTFYELVKCLQAEKPLHDLPGVCFKEGGRVVINPDRPFGRMDDYPPPPYHLVQVQRYVHQYYRERQVIELESSRGCPHDCAFCYNRPYNKRTWRPLGPRKVVDRLRMLKEKYSLGSFHFVDDSFFVDRRRADEIMRLIIAENLDVRLGFQGIRVDTLSRLSDEELGAVYRAGTRFLQFGVESGSPRILTLINKRIKVEDVVELNRRLTVFPDLIPYYNFMCGFPGETREDLFMSTDLAWRLLQGNRRALISPFHHYKPYPGTELATLAMASRPGLPRTLEEWGRFDWTEVTDRRGSEMDRLFKKVEMTSLLADGKLEVQSDSARWTLLAKMYRPVARARLKHNWYRVMPESVLMR